MRKKTREEWIAEAKAIHNDKYDYSKVIYQGNKKQVIIVCLQHGEFRLTPFSHTVNKNGCRACYNKRTSERQTTPLVEVLNECYEKFNNKYSYNVLYYSTKKDSKVKIICPLHGHVSTTSFCQHLKTKNGCRKCNSLSRRSSETEKESLREFKSFVASEERAKNKFLNWLERFRNNFGSLYDYSKVGWINTSKDVITVYCTEHDRYFEQKVNTHVMGSTSCKECILKSLKKNIIPISERLIQLKEIHGDKYDFSLIPEGVVTTDKVKVLCKNSNHGSFDIRLSDLLDGHGCKKCACEANGLNKRLSLGEVLNRFKNQHGHKYAYNFVDYKGQEELVDIVCPKHGIFSQRPSDHWRGDGCRYCGFESRVHKTTSQEELTFFESIQHSNKVLGSYPSEMNGFQVDCYIPELKLGIEYNGFAYHHSSINVSSFHNGTFRDMYYHKNKFDVAKRAGINLIHVFSFEYLEEWTEIINNYIQSPNSYNISFKNKCRTITKKGITLDFYGKSYITLKSTLTS